MIAKLIEILATANNSGHTVTLRSARIRQSRTSYVRQTLAEIPPFACERKRRCEK